MSARSSFPALEALSLADPVSESTPSRLGNTLLYSSEAEEAVLGSVLINAEAYLEVVGFLTDADFYLDKHKWIWRAFARLHTQGMPFDLLTVSTELDAHQHLIEIGGLAFLTRLINAVPTTLHVEAYARLVQRDAIRRRLLEAATQVARLAYAEGRDIQQVVGEAEAAVFAVSRFIPMTEDLDLATAVRAIAQQAETDVDTLMGLATGLANLDAHLSGLQQTDLVIVAGRPGTGKSTLLLKAALTAARAHHAVAFFSREMSVQQLALRLIAQETGIDLQRLRLGQLTTVERQFVTATAEQLATLPLRLYGPGTGATPSQLRATSHRLQQTHGLELVVVDYLQLLRGDGRFPNRQEEVADISRGLKQLAGELNVPLLAGAQLSRALEQRTDKRPQLSDLRESGSIENDADVVMFLHPLTDTHIHLIVAKHRNGPTHPGLDLTFHKSHTTLVAG